MDVKSVKEKLLKVIEAPEDDTKYQTFVNAYIMLLDEVKINIATANIAIEAVKLDQGVNFLDAFVALDKKQVQDAWKVTRNCEEFKNNADYGAFRLMCSFAASALGGDVNTASILGNILTAIVNTAKLPKQEKIDVAIYEVVRELLLEMLPKNIKLPEWKTVKMTPENVLTFCSIMERTLELNSVQETGDTIREAFCVKKWISTGKQYAEEAKVLKEKEKNKPPKKSEELLVLVNHFKSLEEELDKSIQEATKLTLQVSTLQDKLNKSEALERDKDKRIKELQTEIKELKSKVSQANQEVNERKKLNDAQIQYREDSQVSLLQDIARSLKSEYGDYAETKDMPMNELLGEIYREKLKQVFKILEQKGIKVND